MSQRTDGGPTQPTQVASGGAYGERQEMEQIQGGSPMQGSDNSAALAAARAQFGGPTAAPEEPITAGAALGPGIGPAGAGIQNDQEVTNEQLRPLLRSLELVANLPGSNAETRAFVRNLKSRLSSA